MSDMMGGCKRSGGPNCGILDCAWGCAAADGPPPVPTAGVPRTSGFLRDLGPPKVKTDPVSQAVDRWLDMERKAAAWNALCDALPGLVGTTLTPREVLDLMAAALVSASRDPQAPR